ncbi:helix-turn-helix domain-containing protein [Microscilla marina]|uniref:Transcriptional regulator, AraC family protein n=1 Tax=Microscilla marina ATCC 23134 TaxID=313606 RepID=A1ZP42_MICM2|nr:helix-turn-helix domain-containing protein [Microscilla marina]EAY27834.1 transcriptional regulator, AraC family protein [Microscilla marina ATCC 23134]
MSFSRVLLILFFYTGVLQSVFFAVYLFISKRGNQKANKLLGFLLLALVMRLGKSAYIVSTGHYPDVLVNIGLSGYLLIGALMMFYFRALAQPTFSLRNTDFLQLVPWVVAVCCSSIILYPPNYSGAFKQSIVPFFLWYYRGLHAYLLVYLIINFLWLRRFYQSYKAQKNSSTLDKAKWTWMRSLWAMLALVWLAYTTSHFFSFLKYQNALIIYTSLVFCIGLLALTQPQVFTQTFDKPKYKTSPLTDHTTQAHIASVKALMEEGKVFKDAALTLPKLAEMLDMPAYLLSQVINEHLAKNFADFVNQYRIDEAKKLLIAPAFDHYKIAGIAFESGFNNLSSFNTAFKKNVQQTPSQYRKQYKVTS